MASVPWVLPLPPAVQGLVGELCPVELPTPSARAMKAFFARRPLEAWMLRRGLNPFDRTARYTVRFGCPKCDSPRCFYNRLLAQRALEVESDSESEGEGWLN